MGNIQYINNDNSKNTGVWLDFVSTKAYLLQFQALGTVSDKRKTMSWEEMNNCKLNKICIYNVVSRKGGLYLGVQIKA